jgi:hypothetical protein
MGNLLDSAAFPVDVSHAGSRQHPKKNKSPEESGANMQLPVVWL